MSDLSRTPQHRSNLLEMAAVMVTYRPDESVLDNIASFLAVYRFLVIVDNTEQKHSDDPLVSLDEDDAVVLIRNGKNTGIATAINIGCSAAINHGATWITTFDQDSTLLANYPAMITDYLKALSIEDNSHTPEPIFGCTTVERSDNPNSEIVTCDEMDFAPQNEVITSGMSFSSRTFADLRGFDDSFFIDFVDHDFCAKARCANIPVVISEKAILAHELGNQSHHTIFGKRLTTTNHAAFRRYYRARNSILYAKRYRKAFPALVRKHLRLMIREQVMVLLFERKKIQKTKAIVLGCIDGIRGKVGTVSVANL